MTLRDDKPSPAQATADAAERHPKPSRAERSASSAPESTRPKPRRQALDRFFEHPSSRIALILAAAFLVIYASLALTIASEPVTGERTFKLWSNSTKVLLLTIIASLWGVSAYFRCSDAVIRRYIFFITALIVFWGIITKIKYMTDVFWLESILWYAYYIPMTLVPTFILLCALRVTAPEDNTATRTMRRFCLMVSLALGILMLTNNAHQLAFDFTLDDELWRKNYTYGPLYFTVFAWIALQSIAFFALLFTAVRKQLRNVLAFIAGIVLIGMAFCILYILRVEFIFATPFTVIISLFYIAVIELCLRTGLFPLCSDYLQAFYELPIDVKLCSTDHRQTEQTRIAKPPQDGLFQTAVTALQQQGEQASFNLADCPDKTFKAYRILGGAAVVTKDITSISQRKRELEEKQAVLQEQNALLKQYRVAQTRLHRKRSENELFQNIETSLTESVAAIKELLGGLETQADRGASEAAKSERRLTLMRVKLLVSYCKRKGGLVLLEHGNIDFERSRLNLMINETLSDLRPAGIDCAALIEVDDVLPASTTSICCDCLYAFAFGSLSCDNPTIMLFLQNRNDAFVELRIMFEGAKADDIACRMALQKLQGTLENAEADFSLVRNDETVSLSALMPRRR